MFPLVSVIIPVYNVSKFIRESIESILLQTYKNLEIIIVDDGSTDKSGKICDFYQEKDERIRVIHQINKGLSAARNTGLKEINGSMVVFFDPDDVALPNMIEIMVNNMIKHSASVVICSYGICETEGSMQEYKTDKKVDLMANVYSSSKALQKLGEGTINVNVWNKIYDRDLFDDLEFPEGFVYEDVYIMPHIFDKAETIVTIPDQLFLYRKRPYSISATYTDKNMLDWLHAINEWMFFFLSIEIK